MRIISKYKDYYDGIQAFGQDNTCVYERTESIKEFPVPEGFRSIWHSQFNSVRMDHMVVSMKTPWEFGEYFLVNPMVVGFCGKLVPCFSVKHLRDHELLAREVFYDSEGLVRYIQKLKSTYKSLTFKDDYYTVSEPTAKGFDGFLKHQFYKNDYSDWFHHFKAPVFAFPVEVYENSPKEAYLQSTIKDKHVELVVNPQLKKIQFYKFKDAYTCYQDLYQFIGGVLTLNEDIVDKSSDTDKIQQHGFDPKYGFRKRPKK